MSGFLVYKRHKVGLGSFTVSLLPTEMCLFYLEEIMFNEKKYKKQWAKDNSKNIIKARRRWREKNKKYIKKYNSQYRKNNIKKIRELQRQWRKNNLSLKENQNEYGKYRYKVDIKFNLNRKISTAIRLSLKGNKNGNHWENLVDYTLDDLIKRLKRTLPKGYTWKDYLKGKLHIDHIVPISVYNFDNSNQMNFKYCWALKNLRLLPAKENRIKNSKLIKPFQLTFKI